MKVDAINDFLRFVRKEVFPAITDLGKLSDPQRIHVQKLVYTNLVDRFDTLVDSTILENCRNDALVEEASKNMVGMITEAELFRLLMNAETLQGALSTRLQDVLRTSVLRQRHSKKLQTLFKVATPDIDCWNKPRVNPATGEILESIKPPNRQQLNRTGFLGGLIP